MSQAKNEAIWKEHQDTLIRIRSQLSKYELSKKGRSPTNRVRYSPQSHPPYGKYKKPPSPYVERIETPPEHEPYQHKSSLRKSKYDVVPPVKPRKTVTLKSPDYDSWGEEEDSDVSDNDEGDRYPYPYPYYAGPPVVVGAPYGMFYPPPPPLNKNRPKGHGSSKRERSRINDAFQRDAVHQSVPSRSRRERRTPKVSHSVPYQNGYSGYSKKDALYNNERNEALKKYKYIYPRDRDTPYMQNSSVFRYFVDEKYFAQDFIDWFIGDCLETEIIPDLLVDSVKNVNRLSTGDPMHRPSAQVGEDIISSQVDDMLHDIVKQSISEMVDEHLYMTSPITDPLEYWLTKLVNDVVRDMTRESVKEATKELAVDWMEIEQCKAVISDILTDFTRAEAPSVIDEAIEDIYFENFIETDVIRPFVVEECHEVAKEVMNYYDSKIVKRELKEVTRQAGDRLVESFCLDYLLMLISRQGKVTTQNELSDRYLDSIMFDIIFEQYTGVKERKRKTIDNTPLRKMHEKIVTDVGLDVMLQHLAASLDEDLGDVDEFERGIAWNPATPKPHR